MEETKNINPESLDSDQQAAPEEGKVEVEVINNRKGGQPVYDKGKLVDWGGTENWTDYKVKLK